MAQRLVNHMNFPVCHDYDRNNEDPPRLDAGVNKWLSGKDEWVFLQNPGSLFVSDHWLSILDPANLSLWSK